MDSDFIGPDIGSEEMVSINKLGELCMEIPGKKLSIKHIEGPIGVRGRRSDNRMIKEKLHWVPSRPLNEGLKITYFWINEQVMSYRRSVKIVR